MYHDSQRQIARLNSKKTVPTKFPFPTSFLMSSINVAVTSSINRFFKIQIDNFIIDSARQENHRVADEQVSQEPLINSARWTLVYNFQELTLTQIYGEE